MKRPPSEPRQYVYASGWRECRREMALDLTHPDEVDDSFDDESRERMREGVAWETTAQIHLMRAGARADPPFAFEGSQSRVRVEDATGRLLISGKIDGFLVWQDGLRIPVELKSGESVRRTNDLVDFADQSTYTRRYLRQIIVYIHAGGFPFGLFGLKRPGTPKFIEVHADDTLDLYHQFVSASKHVIDYAEGLASIPDYTPKISLCGRCPHHGRSCAPPALSGVGLAFVDDDDLVEAAATKLRLHEAHLEYGQASRALEVLRGQPLVQLGDRFRVTGHWGKRTQYDVPEEVRQKYKRINKEGSWKSEIEEIGK